MVPRLETPSPDLEIRDFSGVKPAAAVKSHDDSSNTVSSTTTPTTDYPSPPAGLAITSWPSDGTLPGADSAVGESAAEAETEAKMVDADAVPAAPHLLVTSPYTTPEHLLDLRTLDPATRLLAQSLALFSATRADYATAPYASSFPFAAIVADLQHRLTLTTPPTPFPARSYYAVAFRSKRRGISPLSPSSTPSSAAAFEAGSAALGHLDERSHAEASASGGLLRYWFGAPDAAGRNLATCVWREREDARRGGTGPWHARARAAAREYYEEVDFRTYRFWIGEGAREWELTEVVQPHQHQHGSQGERRG